MQCVTTCNRASCHLFFCCSCQLIELLSARPLHPTDTAGRSAHARRISRTQRVAQRTPTASHRHSGSLSACAPHLTNTAGRSAHAHCIPQTQRVAQRTPTASHGHSGSLSACAPHLTNTAGRSAHAHCIPRTQRVAQRTRLAVCPCTGAHSSFTAQNRQHLTITCVPTTHGMDEETAGWPRSLHCAVCNARRRTELPRARRDPGQLVLQKSPSVISAGFCFLKCQQKKFLQL